MAVKHIFQRLYSYIFHMGVEGNSVTKMDRPEPIAIFMVNFDKVKRMLHDGQEVAIAEVAHLLHRHEKL